MISGAVLDYFPESRPDFLNLPAIAPNFGGAAIPTFKRSKHARRRLYSVHTDDATRRCGFVQGHVQGHGRRPEQLLLRLLR
jgi:hypothetical protein